jgi:hypothetical protein
MHFGSKDARISVEIASYFFRVKIWAANSYKTSVTVYQTSVMPQASRHTKAPINTAISR